MLNYTRYEMLNKAPEAFGDLRHDGELGPVDWVTVKKNITFLNNLGDDHVHPHADKNDHIHVVNLNNLGDDHVRPRADEDDHTHAMNLKDIHVRLLNGVQATYLGMIGEGWITQATANILMRSVDEAMDLVSSQPLCDWKVLRSNVKTTYNLGRREYFAVQRLESRCYICAAFLRAHRIARRQLYDFLGASEIARIVIGESNAEQEEARNYLEDVLSSLKTLQVTYFVLTHMNQYTQNLRKTGLLEEKRNTDLKKLKRNPPLVKMSRVGDLLYIHPVVSILPSAVRDHLLSNAKETVNEYGPLLYREGSGATGVWLVSIGVEKGQLVDSKSRGQSLDPVLLHGSTLGLYEVLTGKPYICDMIMDSVMHHFFIEAEKIELLRHSDPSAEAFLWQESALLVAKLFIPGIFKKLTMREMRLLIAETSSVNGIYNVGEDIVQEHDYVGILLEGILKTKDKNMLASPGVLLPSNIHSNFGQIRPP
uniref:Cyclic nucleotide-binding domain-containing protein n=1 Tax=Setaria viridis TaxID=4556 RepID=A0A4V6D3Z8_SETVI|nr:hypothetical protein SEVIR_9G144600v2 [Setaria viridis]